MLEVYRLQLLPISLEGDSVFFGGYNGCMSATSGKLKRWLFIIAGTIAIGIGVIGIIVPVLPTTPFLLLAAIRFSFNNSHWHNCVLLLICGKWIEPERQHDRYYASNNLLSSLSLTATFIASSRL